MTEKKGDFKQAVNQRMGAGLETKESEKGRTLTVEPHACGFKAGVDLDKLNQLVGDVEAEAIARKLSMWTSI